MGANPFLGVIFHWLGGLASGSFYVPYKGVRKWSWEVYWMVGGFFSWIICPWLLALLLTQDVVGVLKQQSFTTLWWTYFFGAMWGFGGLTFGLTMRYLGMSLGMGVALGYCAAFGTLIPPVFPALFPKGAVVETIGQIAATTSGKVTLFGVLVCLIGIGIAAVAGLTKEKEMPEAEKKKAIAEFNFTKGILVATFSGVMSACFSFAITWGAPIKVASIAAGTSEIWSGIPRYIVIMLGGFTTNFIWCLLLYLKNKTGYQFFSSTLRNPGPAREQETIIETAVDAPSEEVVERSSSRTSNGSQAIPLLRNYFFSALAGTCWYFQFFFYAMGEVKMGKYNFSSWTLHMASIIIFSTMWGWIFHEWKGSSKKAHLLIAGGIATLVLSTIVIGLGTAMNGGKSFHDILKLIFG
jgi:L-rhamnose-H+ transport protein